MFTYLPFMADIDLSIDRENPHLAWVRVTNPEHVKDSDVTAVMLKQLPKGGQDWWIVDEFWDGDAKAWTLKVEWSK